MGKPKIVGPGANSKYLGHFAGEKVLRDGHNTDKRVPGRPQPRHRSDDPILDEHLLRREGDRFNRDMDNIEAPMKTPGEIMRHRRQIRYIKT